MKKFNLEAALAGEKVITRDGREVTQLVNFVVMTDRSLCGVIDKELCTWLVDGARYVAGVNIPNYQLFMAPKKLSGFVNIYAHNFQPSPIHLTRELADEHCEPSNRLACVDLSKFDEGEGL